MGTEQQVGVLTGQVAFLSFKLCMAELVIDELRKIVQQNTYETIADTIERKFVSNDIEYVKKMKSILAGIVPFLSHEQENELLALISSMRN